MTRLKTACLVMIAILGLTSIASADPFGRSYGHWNGGSGSVENRGGDYTGWSSHTRIERLHNPVTGRNYTAIIQTGNNNQFAASQSGNRNSARVVQRGKNTRVVVKQRGNNNVSSVVILGH